MSPIYDARFATAENICMDLGVKPHHFTRAIQISRPSTDGEYRVCIASVLSTFGRFTDEHIDALTEAFRLGGEVRKPVAVAADKRMVA